MEAESCQAFDTVRAAVYNANVNYATEQRTARAPASVFVAATLVIFFSTLSAADSVGFVPYYIDGTAPAHADVALADLPELGPETVSAPAADGEAVIREAEPVRISIEAIDLDLPVQNPSTRDIAALDALLQKGPARYVDSGKLGTDGNILIFAHSSHLPIVHNQMYKAFNQIPDLVAGDRIVLTGEDGVRYLYRVSSVVKADAEDASVDLSKGAGRRLTLVTCDTLTGKSSRFVLTADFAGTL